MMVVFVSQCRKKSKKKTRRILDTFADRIGNNTWQTMITENGLKAVHLLLRRSATKNTAVSCHWSRTGTIKQLLWVVGNTHSFNQYGIVPVHYSDTESFDMSNNPTWKYTTLFNAIVECAAVLHDIGKHTEIFQNVLHHKKGSKQLSRHETISSTYIASIFAGMTDIDIIRNVTSNGIEFNDFELDGKSKLFIPTAPLITFILQLVITHHRLIGDSYDKGFVGNGVYDAMVKNLKVGENGLLKEAHDVKFIDRDISPRYQTMLKTAFNRLQKRVKQFNNITPAEYHKLFVDARLALMLGDHHYSSLDRSNKQDKKSECRSYANTNNDRSMNQKLDDHFDGVRKNALEAAGLIISLITKERPLPVYSDCNDDLVNFTSDQYGYQDTSSKQVADMYADGDGAFISLLGSTGTGKTIWLLKLINAISDNGIRVNILMGLRSLVLQSTDEYKGMVSKGVVASQIGSQAVVDLHELETMGAESSMVDTGMVSGFDDMCDLIESDTSIFSHIFNSTPKGVKFANLANVPVMISTIDTLIRASENTRSHQIIPHLRLLTSDVVIDEIDDFDTKDLYAVSRLVYLVGLHGGRIIISSATLPQHQIEGFYEMYKQGREQYALYAAQSSNIMFAMIDENQTVCEINPE